MTGKGRANTGSERLHPLTGSVLKALRTDWFGLAMAVRAISKKTEFDTCLKSEKLEP